MSLVNKQKGWLTVPEESTPATAGPDSRRPHGNDKWRPVSRSRAYELVVERVEEQILTGALRVGDRLPAERDLAARLGVSRAAVREAIRTLEAQGVVDGGRRKLGVSSDREASSPSAQWATTTFAIASPGCQRADRD